MTKTEDKKIFKNFIKSPILEAQKKPVTELSFYELLMSRFPVSVITSKKKYQNALSILEYSMEYYEINKSELSVKIRKDLEMFIQAYAVFIHNYEKKEFESELNKIAPKDILEFLMEEHGLNQSDLSKELGGQSIVSNILNGKRSLNNSQISKLSKRFNVSPSVFF